MVFAKTYFIFLPSRASNHQVHSEYFFFTFIRKVMWLIKFETRKCSNVNVKKKIKNQNSSKGASNCQFHSEYFFFTFIRKVTWLIKFETRKCSDVNVKKNIKNQNSSKGLKQVKTFLKQTIKIEYSWKRQTKCIIYLASVQNNIRCN